MRDNSPDNLGPVATAIGQSKLSSRSDVIEWFSHSPYSYLSMKTERPGTRESLPGL